MESNTTLIVDDNTDSLQTILMTLDDAGVPFVLAESSDKAWNLFQAIENVSRVVVRISGTNIDGLKLCRDLRSVRSRDELSVIVLLAENELPSGAEALIAGASDLLVDPFEPRELRMRANIVPGDQNRRIDQAHTLAELRPELASEPQVILPQFETGSLKFGFGPLNHRVEHWEADPQTKRMTMDKVIVCPKCECLPTFRPGCGACGSASVRQQVLLHHFACAHVGPEDEFQTKQGLRCPKCRLTDLIAGSDFEQIQGCTTCMDCDAIVAEPQTLGHCLNCQHRFLAEEGKLVDIVGYQIGASPDSAVVSAPNYASHPSSATSSASD